MSKYEPLSGIELINIYNKIGGKGLPKIWTYKDLNSKSLNEILGKDGKAIVLFMNSMNMGHWCALYRSPNAINFFDSYGNKPDDQYKFIPNHLASSLNGQIKRLTKMLYDEAKNGTKINWNEYELQDWDNKRIATCGRWCVIRIAYPNISVSEFKNVFYGKALSPDDLITALT